MNSTQSMKRFLTKATVILGIVALSYDACALLTPLPDDGWFTWNVTAIADKGDSCCYALEGGQRRVRACHLDQSHGVISQSIEGADSMGEMQIYVRRELGKTSEIRALSSDCPNEISTLQDVSTLQSVRWLSDYIDAPQELGTQALFAIAIHQGAAAAELLVNTANHHANLDTRRQAIFWIAHYRIEKMSEFVQSLIFRDERPEIRKHAAFSYAQSSATDRSRVLTKLSHQDESTQVRATAWFWLSKIAATEAEIEISKAIKTEASQEVREQAIFALTQLPEDRAYAALVSIIEDQSITKNDRKRALFWLAQLDSDTGREYLQNLLTRS